MKDTHPLIEEKYMNMIMGKTGEERLRMGFEMCETARKLITASVLQEAPQASELDIKIALFERFYGKDLSLDVGKKIIEKIKK